MQSRLGRITHSIGLAIATLAFIMLGPAPSSADGRRVALVIGNGQYQAVTPLINPPNDAGKMAETLKLLGFDEVRQVLDASVAELRAQLSDFSKLAEGADIALVFYAGHGMEVAGQNYLIPVDFKMGRLKDVEFQAVTLRQVQSAVEDAKSIGIIILDACRNNPFLAQIKDPADARAISHGLARPTTRGNTLIMFAARDGTTASDGRGGNSPFTTALLKSIVEPGLEIGILTRKVRDDVIQATGPDDPQEPFEYGSISAKPIYLRPVPEGTLTPAKAKLALEPTLDEYRTFFRTALLRPEWDKTLEFYRQRLTAGRPRYEAVANATNVPWFVIGIWHMLEAGGNFNAHLHNGDPLTARTRQVPVGRPSTGSPPFTWEESAIDAVKFAGFDKVRVWTVEDTLSVFERYNGKSIRKRGIATPYLWSGSNHYTKGKFVADGVFDPDAVSKQIGAGVLLKYAVPVQELERRLNYTDN